MADQQLDNLGPWPLGFNNKEKETSVVFAGNDKRPPQLREAVNVDIDNEGWVSRRQGFSKVLSLESGHSGYSIGGYFYYVDDGILKEYDSKKVLKSGLFSGYMTYEEVGGHIYFCNGFDVGCIVDNEYTHWGLEIPLSPSLSITSGNLHPGTYLVTITYEDHNGLESGAPESSLIELSSPAGISCNWSVTDSNAAYVNIYVSGTSGKQLLWYAKVPASLGNYPIMENGRSADPLTTFNFHPPPKGHIVTNHGGWLFVAKDNELYWSQPLGYHHFDISNDVILFSDRIVLLEPSGDGLYIATADSKLYFVRGIDPHEWVKEIKATQLVAEGRALRTKASDIGIELLVDMLVPVFASEGGLIVGLPDGNIKYLTEDFLSLNTYANSSIIKREHNGISQFLTNLKNKVSESQFGARDSVTVEVIRNE